MNFLSLNSRLIDTVIFDFDGTLAELNIDFGRMRFVVDRLITLYGMDVQDLQSGYILEKISEAEARLQMQSPVIAQSFLTEAFGMIEKIEVEAAEKGQLFEKSRSVLAELRQHDIRTGIITRNCARAVYTVFPDMGSYCPAFVSREDVKHVKPHPEHLGKVLQILGGNAQTSLMVGDHPLDIEAGRAAGTLTAGVLSGHFIADDFNRAGADIVLKEAAEILTRLKRPGEHSNSG